MPPARRNMSGYSRRFSAAVKLRQNKRATRNAARRRLTSTIKAVVARGKESKDNHSALSAENAVSSSGAFHGSIMSMAQGTGVWYRQGDTVQPTKIDIRYQWGQPASSDLYNNVRVMLVQLKVPASEASTSDFPSVFGHPDDEFRRKYRILYDRRHTLNAKQSGDNAGSIVEHAGAINRIVVYGKKLHKCVWNDTGSNVEPNLKGGFKMYTVSDSAPATTHPWFTFQFDEYMKDDD